MMQIKTNPMLGQILSAVAMSGMLIGFFGERLCAWLGISGAIRAEEFVRMGLLLSALGIALLAPLMGLLRAKPALLVLALYQIPFALLAAVNYQTGGTLPQSVSALFFGIAHALCARALFSMLQRGVFLERIVT